MGRPWPCIRLHTDQSFRCRPFGKTTHDGMGPITIHRSNWQLQEIWYCPRASIPKVNLRTATTVVPAWPPHTWRELRYVAKALFEAFAAGLAVPGLDCPSTALRLLLFSLLGPFRAGTAQKQLSVVYERSDPIRHGEIGFGFE